MEKEVLTLASLSNPSLACRVLFPTPFLGFGSLLRALGNKRSHTETDNIDVRSSPALSLLALIFLLRPAVALTEEGYATSAMKKSMWFCVLTVGSCSRNACSRLKEWLTAEDERRAEKEAKRKAKVKQRPLHLFEGKKRRAEGGGGWLCISPCIQ